MWQMYNPNPYGRKVKDCTVRAVSAALNLSWDEAYRMICNHGFEFKDMPSSDSVWGNVFKIRDFERVAIPSSYPGDYTAEDFCLDNRKGLFVLGFGNHVATVKNGVILDAWDSSSESPQYFWAKR